MAVAAVMAVRPHRRRKWATGRATTVPCVHPQRDLFTIERNPYIQGTNHDGQRESERGIVGGEVLCTGDIFKIFYHQIA